MLHAHTVDWQDECFRQNRRDVGLVPHTLTVHSQITAPHVSAALLSLADPAHVAQKQYLSLQQLTRQHDGNRPNQICVFKTEHHALKKTRDLHSCQVPYCPYFTTRNYAV